MTASTSRDVPQNSIVAYHELHDLKERQQAVYSVVAECPGISAQEAYRVLKARGHKVQEKSVTPRFRELVLDGRIKVIGKKINRTTGRSVSMYEVV